MFKLGDHTRFLSEEWHDTRQAAREETMTQSEWGPIDITKYDLDSVDFSGKDNARTYKFRNAVNDDEIDVSGFDLRDIEGHD